MIPKDRTVYKYLLEDVLRWQHGTNTNYSDKKILKEVTPESNEHTHKTENSLKCYVFWATLYSFDQLGHMSDPYHE